MYTENFASVAPRKLLVIVIVSKIVALLSIQNWVPKTPDSFGSEVFRTITINNSFGTRSVSLIFRARNNDKYMETISRKPTLYSVKSIC